MKGWFDVVGTSVYGKENVSEQLSRIYRNTFLG